MNNFLASFGWQNAVLGGIVIGISSSLLLLFLGKISGVSGIIKQILENPSQEHYWKYTFLLGLVFGSFSMSLIYPNLFKYDINLTVFEAVIGGFMVGFGTLMGSGCTSGMVFVDSQGFLKDLGLQFQPLSYEL